MDKWEYQNNPCHLENIVVRELCKRRTVCTFDTSPLTQFSKFNNFLWVCWFLCKNLSNFVTPLENSTTRIAIMLGAQTEDRKFAATAAAKNQCTVPTGPFMQKLVAFSPLNVFSQLKLLCKSDYQQIHCKKCIKLRPKCWIDFNSKRIWDFSKASLPISFA